jgi:hypothetical protein
MLTYAIAFIQNIQLASFALVFVLMAASDRTNRSLRWLAYAYVAGFAGGIFEMGGRFLPNWISVPLATLAAPVGYACLHAGIVHFVHRGARTRWVSDSACTPDVQGHTFADQRMKRLIEFRWFHGISLEV